jgi:chromosome segregation ATPase
MSSNQTPTPTTAASADLAAAIARVRGGYDAGPLLEFARSILSADEKGHSLDWGTVLVDAATRAIARASRPSADILALCTAAEQSAKLRGELASWRRTAERVEEELAIAKEHLRASRAASAAFESDCDARERERDEARESVEALERGFSDLNDGCVALEREHAALKAECERLRGAMRRISDANPGASLHCDTAKERSAFDYGYRSACQRLVDTIAAEEIKASTEAQLRAGREG